VHWTEKGGPQKLGGAKIQILKYFKKS
jgi:hypothetical protein